MVFNATFNNVSVISWRSAVLVYWWTAPFFYLDMTFSQVKFNTRAVDKKRRRVFLYRKFSFSRCWRFFGPIFKVVTFFSTLVCFATICNNVSDFNHHNLVITEKPLHQLYRFSELLKMLTVLYYWYNDSIYKYILLAEIWSEMVFNIHVFIAVKVKIWKSLKKYMFWLHNYSWLIKAGLLNKIM